MGILSALKAIFGSKTTIENKEKIEQVKENINEEVKIEKSDEKEKKAEIQGKVLQNINTVTKERIDERKKVNEELNKKIKIIIDTDNEVIKSIFIGEITENISNVGKENEGIKVEIIKVLLGAVVPLEIKEVLSDIGYISNQKCSALIRQMVVAKKLIRIEEKKIAKFKLAEDYIIELYNDILAYDKKNKLSKKKNNNFSNERKEHSLNNIEVNKQSENEYEKEIVEGGGKVYRGKGYTIGLPIDFKVIENISDGLTQKEFIAYYPFEQYSYQISDVEEIFAETPVHVMLGKVKLQESKDDNEFVTLMMNNVANENPITGQSVNKEIVYVSGRKSVKMIEEGLIMGRIYTVFIPNDEEYFALRITFNQNSPDEEPFVNSFIETLKIHTPINKRIDNNKSDSYIKSVNSSGISQTQIKNERIKQEIVEFLQNSEEPKQIKEMEKLVQTHTNQKISALLRQLVAEGKVNRIEKNKCAYFETNVDYNFSEERDKQRTERVSTTANESRNQNKDNTVKKHLEKKSERVIQCEVVGTAYEGRADRIELINKGDTLKIIRRPNNTHDANAIEVTNNKGQSLGHISRDSNVLLAKLIDNNIVDKFDVKVSYVLPKSKRGPRAKNAELRLEIKYTMDYSKIPSTYILVGGDQLNIWYQEMKIIYNTIPVETAKLFFELHNIKNDEYSSEEDDLSYIGLDDLETDVVRARKLLRSNINKNNDYSSHYDEFANWCENNDLEEDDFAEYVKFMAKKQPQRYSKLLKYIPEETWGECTINTIFEEQALFIEELFWEDETRITSKEWQEATGFGFNHWYEVCELFTNTDIPIDINDKDVVSIFGNDKFIAFADLSYGC